MSQEHWVSALCYTFIMIAYYSDTQSKMEALQVQLLRAAPSWRKMELLAGLNEAARTLALTGLRRRHPKANEQELNRLIEALKDDFYIDDEMIADAVMRRTSFNIIHRDSMFKVDVFIPRQRNFDKMQLSRARQETLSRDPETHAIVATAEDTKLEWFRMGGEVSERQWRDVLGVIKVQGSALDIEYLRSMAKEINVDDLLERAIS